MTRTFVPFAAASLAFATTVLFGGLGYAADIKVMSSVGYRGAISELARKFGGITGHKVFVDFEVVAVLKRRIDADEKFDVAVLGVAQIDELIRVGKVVADTRATIGRIGMGLAVVKGGARPDIRSPEAFRQALLSAKSIGYSREGGSQKTFFGVLDRLGIAAEMKPRIKAVGAPTIQALIDGDVEFVFTSVALILSDSAVELVGRLPPELQSYAVPIAGANAASRELEAAKAFIRFLTSPAAVPVLEAYGVETSARDGNRALTPR